MSNYTIEDYKNAIKAKYKEEADGEYSNYLSSPTTANLRKLCIKRFKSNNNSEDLNGFESFFDFPFDKDKKNLFGDDELNKLEAVKRFLLGKTEKPNDDTIQLAAILVDLRPRPFKEFRKQIDPENLKLINELRNTSHKEVVAYDNVKEIQNNFAEAVTKEVINEAPEIDDPVVVPPLKLINQDDNGQVKTKFNKLKYWVIGSVFFLILIGLGIYTQSQKDCMQWSEDHYELVDCDVKTEGFAATNPVELLDESLINLKKVEVCDTTRCFDKNGDAIYWYAKTANGIDFFNGHGRHPENNSPLKPVTQYILNKYVKKH